LIYQFRKVEETLRGSQKSKTTQWSNEKAQKKKKMTHKTKQKTVMTLGDSKG
jgi:hypothetical protein